MIRMEIGKLVEYSKALVNQFSSFRESYKIGVPIASKLYGVPTPIEMFQELKNIEDHDYLLEFGKKPTEEEKNRRIKIVPSESWSDLYDYMGDELAFLITPFKIFSERNLLIQKIVKEIFVEYKEQLKKISPESDKVENIAITAFLHYFEKLLVEYIDKKLTDAKIKAYAKIFLNELNLKPIKNITINEIWGFAFEEGYELKIGDCKLKKPTKNDFYKLEDKYPTNFHISIKLPRFIIEVTKTDNGFSKIERLEQKILQLLRLYKNGSINFGYKYRYRYSMIHNQLFFHKKTNDYKPIIYILRKKEIELFTEFMDHFLPKLNKFPSPNDYHTISMERYNWSINENLGIDRRLMFAVMGLEPLFLKNKEFGANSYKLGMRISTFLKCLNLRPDAIREDIVKAYRYRNIVVHGSIYPNNWEYDINLLYPKIINYLRISILLFSEFKNKNKLIDLLEESFTLKSKYKELKDTIYENEKTLKIVKQFL